MTQSSVPPSLTREQLRSRRRREVRAKTISTKRMTKSEIELGRALFPPGEHDDIERPRTRADCEKGERPCPFVSCAHHLYLDVSPQTGAIKVNFPDVEPDNLEQLQETCVLDVAAREGAKLEEVGGIMNLTRERVRQLQIRGLAKLQSLAQLRALIDMADDDVAPKRRLPIVDQVDGDFEGVVEFDVESFVSFDD